MSVTINERVVYERGEEPKLSYHEIDDVLNGIKNPKEKDLILKIRSLESKSERDELKKNLRGIMFSGVFWGRNDSDCVEHSGFICLDFDKLGDKLQTYKDKIKTSEYTYSVFDSPSGNGLKIIVKIPPSLEEHTDYFYGLEDYYDSEFFDKTSRNLSRICFISYDPDIYINKESKVFDRKRKQKEIIYTTNETINKILKWWNEKYGLVSGNRNNNCFVLASAFNRYGIVKELAMDTMLKFEQKDFRAYEIKGTVNSAYQKKDLFGTQHFSNLNENEAIDVSFILTGQRMDMSDMFAKTFIDIDKPIAQPPVLVSIGTHYYRGNPFPTRMATEGNISVIMGESKSKKTFFKSLVTASYIGGDTYKYSGDMLGHRENDKYVIDIDTEQSEFDAQRVFKRVQDLVGASVSDFYKPFSMRGFDGHEIIMFIDYLLYESEFKNNVGWLSIDGIADLIDDANDIKQSKQVVTKVMKWTKEQKCHVNTIIHTNVGSEKPTGHLGSFLLKKAETICSLKKDDEMTIASFPYTRGHSIKSFPYYVDADWMPVVVGSQKDSNNKINF